MKKLVIIPTYNEIENIEKIIRKVFSLADEFHVIIIDDGSPDGTANMVKQLQTEFTNKLFLIERQGKQGLGTAYIAGFKWGLENKYDYLFEMDADFSHNPDDLIRLFNACHQDGADMSVGSRYISGGKVVNWPMNRILISYGASVYVRLITWMHVKDCTAGFVCYKRKVLESIDLDKIAFIGYAFQIEMKFRALKKGFIIKEVPITFVDRKEGHSKMSKGIIKEAILGVWKMKFS
ncbi:MAG TPA: polyprenol monophosphomannose synthase [Chitinophagaceae bacterium]|nr:polyprenol monophosphomannose synthase [Chitinophagaceae bacterium]